MSYKYADHRPYVFTEMGQVALLSVIRTARECLAHAGAVRCDKLLESVDSCPDSWQRLALVDRLVELEMLRDITVGLVVPTQHRVYVAGARPL